MQNVAGSSKHAQPHLESLETKSMPGLQDVTVQTHAQFAASKFGSAGSVQSRSDVLSHVQSQRSSSKIGFSLLSRQEFSSPVH